MRQKTETMLCAAFMELLKKCPFSKITIQKLAGQCGVNRQTFYYHFDNIYDISCGYFSKNTEAFSGKKQEEFCNDFFTLGITQYVLEWAENDFREPIEDIIAHLSWLLQKVYV